MTLFNIQSADRVIAAQPARNYALALSVLVSDLRGGPAVLRTEKVIEMTATQQHGNPVTRFAKTVMGVFRTLNSELTATGEAIARSNRFPQPNPQAGMEQAKQAHPAGKALAEV